MHRVLRLPRCLKRDQGDQLVTSNPSFMQAAIAAALITRGSTWPRPAVGCVLVDPVKNEIVATGATQPSGRPHAEMHALSQTNQRGLHAYVTLEPCNHTSPGKPCSCAQGLIDAGVTHVFIAVLDPDARMMGKSVSVLRDAGISVHIGLEADAAYDSMCGHIMRVQRQRPFITLKLAQSKDGFIGRVGERVNISAPASWDLAFALRGASDAVLVGSNTAIIDKPRLNDRRAQARHQPLRMVLDRTGRVDPALGLERVAGKDLNDAMRALYDRGLTHILVEGGAALAQSLMDSDLVDELVLIEGATTIGPGIPCPKPQRMILRDTHSVGPDTWKIYDSENARALKHAFFAAYLPKDGQA